MPLDRAQVTEHCLLLVIDGATFDVVVSTGIVDFLQNVIASHRSGTDAKTQLTVIVLGPHHSAASKVSV